MTPKRRKRQVRTAAVYARRSKEKETLGIDLQLRHCRERAVEEGWSVREFTDDGRSGWDSNVRREGYEALLDAIRSGEVDGVLIYKADRLTRDDRERRKFEDLYEQTGLWLVALANGKRFDLTTADGKKDLRDAATAAAYSSDLLSERMRDHHRSLAEAGKDSGGMRPYGFEPDRVTIRKPEAKVIRDAARRVLRGESLRAICARLNAAGEKTANGARWRPTRFRRILTSARYAGFRELDGERVPAVWEAILDEETFDLIGALLADPDRKTAESTARRHVLAGFVWCENCGKRLYSHGVGKGRRVYRCHTGPNYDGCGKVSIDGPKLDEYVCEAAYLKVQHIIEASDEPAPGVDVSRTEELRDVDARLREAGGMYAAGDIDAVAFAEASKQLRTRRSAIAAALPPAAPHTDWSALYAEIMSSKAPWEDGFDVADLDDWRAMLTLAIERVAVRPALKRGGRFNAERAEIQWRSGVKSSAA